MGWSFADRGKRARTGLLAFAACGVLGGCGGTLDAPPAPGTGSGSGLTPGSGQAMGVGSGTMYRLVQIDGQNVPRDNGPLPLKCPPVPTTPPCDPDRPQPCHQVLAEGSLSLDVERGRFALFRLTRNTCEGSVLSEPSDTGSYQVRGNSLTFEVPGFGPRVFYRFDGVVQGQSLDVDLLGIRLRFQHSDGPAPQLLEGKFPLSERRDGNLAVAGVAATPPRCPGTIKAGALTLEPARGMEPVTGTFHLIYEYTSPCEQAPSHQREERGTYEQVASSLMFTADLGPRVVHIFVGTIASPEIVLHIGGESDLVFRR